MARSSRIVINVDKMPRRVYGHGSRRSLIFDGGSIVLYAKTDALKDLADILQVWKIRLNDREFRRKRSSRVGEAS